MSRIIVYLTERELTALRRQAEHELRGLREQARYLIVRGLTPNAWATADAQADADPQPAGGNDAS